jgi:hypothetical protein
MMLLAEPRTQQWNACEKLTGRDVGHFQKVGLLYNLEDANVGVSQKKNLHSMNPSE